MKADVHRLNKRIRNMNRFLLDPKSTFMQIWDFFTLSALFFTLTVTPFEACAPHRTAALSPPTTPACTHSRRRVRVQVALLETKFDTLFFINWFVNLIFICDMVINFNLPYKGKLGTVKSHKKIAKRYLSSWFTIDLISILPFDSVEIFANLLSFESPFGDNSGTLKIIKMVRLLRLLKLARILRASRIFSRWENELGMSYQKMELIKWTLLVFCVMHLLACFWCLIATMWGSLRDSIQEELEKHVTDCLAGNCLVEAFNGVCTGCVKDKESPWHTSATQLICDSNVCLTDCELALMEVTWRPDGELMPTEWILANENWKCRYQHIVYPQTPDDPRYSVGAVYAAALYVAMLQVGGGVGSIVPTNTLEYIFTTFSLLAGSTIWALIVGTICGIVATGDPHTTEFKQKMDELNYFMLDMNISQPMRVRAREYFRNTRDLRKKLSYADLLDRLSPTLRGEVVLQMSKKTLETVWYLRSCEPAFLVELAVMMEREGYAPREKIPSTNLCIVMRGVAAKAGNILTVSDHWGEDMIVSSMALRDMRHASALTYVEVGTIAREDLEEVLERFPVSERAIRQSAMKIAMQRAIVVISEFVRLQQAKAAGGTDSGREKLAGAVNVASALPGGVDGDPNDASVILNMITGGKMKEIDSAGLVIEGEDDDEPSLPRRCSSMASDAGEDELLKELRESRKEMKQAMAEMRKEIADLKSHVDLAMAQPKM